jgi:hypothetical protein
MPTAQQLRQPCGLGIELLLQHTPSLQQRRIDSLSDLRAGFIQAFEQATRPAAFARLQRHCIVSGRKVVFVPPR